MNKSIEYVPIERLKPGQTSVSYEHIQYLIKKDGETLAFQDGKAWAGEKDAAPGVLLPDQTILVSDKHHHILASVKCKAKSYPVIITDNFSDLDLKQAYTKAQEKQKVYFEPEENIDALMDCQMESLRNNPWRGMSTRVRARVKFKWDEKQKVARIESKGAEFPVWAKVEGKAKDFIEMRIASILRINQIPPEEGTLKKDLVEKIRSLLKDQKDKKNPALDDVVVVEESTPIEEINWTQYLK